ncbi:MAG: HEAT repeat domain-containing protein [Pirellulales bacterium]
MSSSPPPSERFSPDDALPPVEPPSAGFILQLFVVPGAIVVVIVMVWLMFNWLAHMGNDRDAYVRALSRNNEARWQAAFNLANALRSERNAKQPELTVDNKLAEQLAGILQEEIEGGSMEERPVSLRIYLCRALGEFRVDDGLPALIKAASTQRADAESDVRRAAIEGIALLAANFPDDDPRFVDNQKLREALSEAAGDSDHRTRAAAAVAMGVIAGPVFIDKLHFMLADSHPDVRYNAALRLAHRGDAAAVDVLAEMLDQDETAGVEAEQQAEMRGFKRSVITVNALRATQQLAEKNPGADLGALEVAIERLRDSTAPADIRVEATSTLQKLRGRAAQPTS